MKIQEATIHDARRISYLISKSTNSNPNDYSKAQIEVWKKYNTPSRIKSQLQDRKIFCAFKNNKLIGTIALKDEEVHGFYVSFSLRKKGIGSKLLTYIERYAKQNNIKSLYLTSTPSALKFYQSKGYQQKKEVNVAIFGVNFPEVIMEKEL